MSAYIVRFPDGFVPEEHGWETPDVNADNGDIWLRWEPPYKGPASLVKCLFDEPTGAVGGLYSPAAQNVPEAVPAGVLWEAILNRPDGEAWLRTWTS